MAFLNYLTNGSYSVIDRVSYTKNRAIDAVLLIYENSNKTTILGEKLLSIRNLLVPRVRGVLLTSPPENPVEGDYWIAASSYVDEFSNGPVNKPKSLVKQLADGRSYQGIGSHEVFYDLQENSYISVLDNDEVVLADPWKDSVLFEEYFSMQNEENVVGNIYTFLKNHISEYSTCVDV